MATPTTTTTTTTPSPPTTIKVPPTTAPPTTPGDGGGSDVTNTPIWCPAGKYPLWDPVAGRWRCVLGDDPTDAGTLKCTPPKKPTYDPVLHIWECRAPAPGIARAAVVTLGDSFASGVGFYRADDGYDDVFGTPDALGPLTAGSDGRCWRETDKTPGPRIAVELGLRSIMKACKGARIVHVATQLSALNRDNQVDAARKWDTSIFLIVAGGNDVATGYNASTGAPIDWPATIVFCIFTVDCAAHSPGVVNGVEIEVKLIGLYVRLAREASKAQIRVMGYPHLMSPWHNFWGSLVCPDVTGISGAEARWLDEQSDRLNERIIAAVATVAQLFPDVDIEFVDVRGAIWNGACNGGSPNAQIHDKVVSLSAPLEKAFVSPASFHPTALGYSAYYDVVRPTVS